MKRAEDDTKLLYQEKIKKNSLVILNTYAPHLGIVNQDEAAVKYYRDLQTALIQFKRLDLIITRDFNAKLGKQTKTEFGIGAHARGSRNTNGELQKFQCENNLVASNTLFKHRACHITTWEGCIRGKKYIIKLLIFF